MAYCQSNFNHIVTFYTLCTKTSHKRSTQQDVSKVFQLDLQQCSPDSFNHHLNVSAVPTTNNVNLRAIFCKRRSRRTNSFFCLLHVRLKPPRADPETFTRLLLQSWEVANHSTWEMQAGTSSDPCSEIISPSVSVIFFVQEIVCLCSAFCFVLMLRCQPAPPAGAGNRGGETILGFWSNTVAPAKVSLPCT